VKGVAVASLFATTAGARTINRRRRPCNRAWRKMTTVRKPSFPEY